MDTEHIEQILRNTPALKTPDLLLKKLTADIRVPRAEAIQTGNWTAAPSWARRWLPALSFAAIFLTCLVAIGVQTNLISVLERENAPLRAKLANTEALQTENAEYQKLLKENQELDRLRKDNAELLKLRAEVTQLRAQVVDVTKLQAENQRLAAAVNAAGGAAGANQDFFAEAKDKAERIKCVNNLKQIGLAIRIWENDNKGLGPVNFVCMSNELSTCKILQCPSDKTPRATNWAEVAAGNVSYQLYTEGLTETMDPLIVVCECPLHHNIGFLDGSVTQLSETGYNKIQIVNGRKMLVR